MIQINPKIYNRLIAGVIALVIMSATLLFVNTNNKKRYEKELHNSELEIVKYKTEAEQLIKNNQNLKRAIRVKDEAYIKLDTAFRNNTELYITKVEELRKSKQKVKEVFLPYKDSTEVAVALVQFEGCKEENKIVIAQRDLLKSKSSLQDSIIVNLEQVITLDRKMFTNYENQIEIHKKNEKRLRNRVRIGKFTTVAVGVIGIIGIILL